MDDEIRKVDMQKLGVDVLINAPQKGWSGPASSGNFNSRFSAVLRGHCENVLVYITRCSWFVSRVVCRVVDTAGVVIFFAQMWAN